MALKINALVATAVLIMISATSLRAGGFSAPSTAGTLNAPADALIRCATPLRDLEVCPVSDNYWGTANWPANPARSNQLRGKGGHHRLGPNHDRGMKLNKHKQARGAKFAKAAAHPSLRRHRVIRGYRHR